VHCDDLTSACVHVVNECGRHSRVRDMLELFDNRVRGIFIGIQALVFPKADAQWSDEIPNEGIQGEDTALAVDQRCHFCIVNKKQLSADERHALERYNWAGVLVAGIRVVRPEVDV